MTDEVEVVRTLTLPFEKLKTVHLGHSEVRLYENRVTGTRRIGKTFDTLGLDESVAATEAIVLESIQHDCVVPVWGVAEVDDPTLPNLRVLEMLMPYYPRGSVLDAIDRGERFSTEEARRILLATATGLQELHSQQGILHRDVKSPNVFLTSGEPAPARIGDLSAAARAEADGSADALAQPQLWTPPETFTEKRYRRSGDVFSLGVVAIELLNGPFDYAEFDIDLCARRLAQGLPYLTQADLAPKPWVPKALRKIVNKSVRNDPELRYQNAAEVADALRGAEGRLVSWFVKEPAADEPEWEGSVPGRSAGFRVSTSRMKRSGLLRLTGQAKRTSRWRRVVEDVDVATISSPEATAFFDQIVTIATS